MGNHKSQTTQLFITIVKILLPFFADGVSTFRIQRGPDGRARVRIIYDG